MSDFPGGGADVPSLSNHLGKDNQVWERPWTLGEMRQASANWSLAADSGLFLFLQDFSQRMLSKTHDIEKQLDGLMRDTKATDSCLHSVFNDFLMLSNTQFIENRVYDEEVEEPTAKVESAVKHPEKEKTREQIEAELIPKMQEAVNYGLRVLDSAFEQLDIKAGNSDSEDEEAMDRVEAILEPKDLYVDRPLPYLIGSQAFMEQDDVGLGDLSSDEMSIDSDRDSVIESEDGKEEVQSDEFEEAEGRGSINKKSSVLSYEEDEEEDEDSDIFGESDKEEEYEDENERKIASSTSFVDELAARIKGDPVSKGEEDRASLASSKKRAKKSKKVAKAEKSTAAAAPVVRQESGDMFLPPRMEEDEFSPFGGEGGLFSGGRGLFDDDDEGDLFGDKPKPGASEDKAKAAAHMAESVKPEKKTPVGAVSIFPADNGLFGSGHSTAPVEGKENGTHGKPKAHPSPKQLPVRASGIGGGLFDDEEEDDFFSGRSLKTSSSAGREKSKTKKVADLFLGDDDDDEEDEGDIFSEKSAVQPPVRNKKEVVEEGAIPPEKKMPAGAISIFGPGTKSLLTESLRRRRASTSEGSEKSEENGPHVEAPVNHTTPGNQTQIPQARGLFSDDEDTQAFPTSSKKQPKAPVSLFDDEEEEDLFASVAKSKPKPSQPKATTPQPQKTLSLFSDDEDQWLGSRPGTGRTETKTGGMKASVSAPSNLPGARAPSKGSLFDDEDEDLFATTKTSSPLKSQRVALLFEDDEGFLFGSKPAVSSSAKSSAAKAPVVAPKAPAPSLFDQEPRKEVPASENVVEKAKPTEDTCAGEVLDRQPPPSSSSSSSSTSSTISSSLPPSDREPRKQKPAGAVSLFGGIDILASRRREGVDGDFLTKDRLPPPDVGEEDEEEEVEEKTREKTKANPVSIFDEEDNDNDDEEEDTDWNVSTSVVRPPIITNTIQPAREPQRTKSTGVFQDEELLFSATQQKDNDPDVDLFATSGKTLSAKPSSVKTDVPSLFADDDDDLFSSAAPKPPHPKVAKKPSKPKEEPTASWKGVSAASTPDSERTAASPVKANDPSSRIGKLQANLVINPKALLPGAGPRIPGANSALPGTTTGSSSGVSSSSLSPSPVTTPLGFTHSGMEEGVSFESPLQVATLSSTNKSRVKGSGQRRPQSRAARQQSVQRSVSDQEDSTVEPNPRLNPAMSALGFPTAGKPNLNAPRPMLPKPSGTSAFPTPSPSQLSFTESLTRPSVLSLPVPTLAGEMDSSEVSGDTQAMLSSSSSSSDDEDLFGSVAVSKSSAPPAPRVTQAAPDPSPAGGPAPVSIFDNQATSDLFQKMKPRAKKAQAPSFMEDADDDGDDDEDIFGMSTGSTPSSTSESKTPSSPAKLDIFQDNETLPKAIHKKHKEKTMEASLFDDNVDIFADLTMSSGPKDKPKKKMDTKSIFDDDMDDIFSSNKVKPVKKAPPKSKKSKPTQDNSVTAESANIFDDPLNAFGGN